MQAERDPRAQGLLAEVRELLFGSDRRSSEARLARLEAELARELADVRRRLDALEGRFERELAALAQRVEAECSARGTERHDLGRSIDELRAQGVTRSMLAEQLSELARRVAREGREES